jgi:hypothetical protein
LVSYAFDVLLFGKEYTQQKNGRANFGPAILRNTD